MINLDENTDKLPPIPQKRYFTIGEVSSLCAVKSQVLQYWEQEFPQLNPAKRRGNRKYYLYEDVLVVRQIRNLLYDEGFTISSARSQISNIFPIKRKFMPTVDNLLSGIIRELEEILLLL